MGKKKKNKKVQTDLGATSETIGNGYDPTIITSEEPKPTKNIPKKVYKNELKRLQIELVKLQTWIKEKGLKVAIIFEGRDAAGKGGTIKRITECLNPGFAALWLWEPPLREKRVNGISNAMCPIYRRLGRWSV